MNGKLLISYLIAASLCFPSILNAAPAKPKTQTKPKASTNKPTVKPKPSAENSSADNAAAILDTGKTTWALLVGISQYQSSQITSLHYPVIDIKAIADALKDPKLGHVPADHIKVLTDSDATAANIYGAVDTFLKPNVKPGDQIVVFLAGHGVAKGVGAQAKGYLLPYDVRGLSTPALDASAVSLHDLSQKIGALPASQFVAFVDACREDPTPGRGIKGNTLTDVVEREMQIVPQDENRPAASVTFYACSVGQRAFEDPAYKHGVFTYWILDGIKQAAIPKKPDGAIDMGLLSGYVQKKVQDWSKQTSSGGDFEVDQTPVMVTSSLPKPVVLMNVRRPLPDQTIPASLPRLIVSTYPEGAKVEIDGADVGAGTVEDALSAPGEHTVKAAAPGYDTIEKKINTFDGYGTQLVVTLPPQGRGLTASNDPSVVPASAEPATYTKALKAEQSGSYEIAIAGYNMTIQSEPKFQPAYERLANILRLQGRIGDAVGVLINMTASCDQSAHGYSLLSYNYSLFAEQGMGASTNEKAKGTKDFGYPKSQADAGSLAVKAANAAIKLDGNSAEAQRSLGFALTATDKNGKNKNAALDAFGKAVFMDDNDAANHFGLGFGIRVFNQTLKDADKRSEQLKRALAEQQAAVKLRPNYYEAHREMAYCYHLMDDRANAEKEYETANANRGSATDGNEVAGVNCALAVLHKQDADNAPPDKKDDYTAASKGYWADAKDITPDLKKAMTYLRDAGLSTRIVDYLPPEMQKIIDWKGTVGDAVNNAIGGLHIPHF